METIYAKRYVTLRTAIDSNVVYCGYDSRTETMSVMVTEENDTKMRYLDKPMRTDTSFEFFADALATIINATFEDVLEKLQNMIHHGQNGRGESFFLPTTEMRAMDKSFTPIKRTQQPETPRQASTPGE